MGKEGVKHVSIAGKGMVAVVGCIVAAAVVAMVQVDPVDLVVVVVVDTGQDTVDIVGCSHSHMMTQTVVVLVAYMQLQVALLVFLGHMLVDRRMVLVVHR